ncbi:hypothetical protein XA68_17849 [Ophiocordyceps unilateralis]|uniref:Uncharacterized protein n=1 Tax=Ophiocordyceps unilateralis TaxID=268505 RepID=A0A2A9P490_OPHUN|nr:hypothetical protein XA68_17849 [Ophiocordyceps unilateralis]
MTEADADAMELVGAEEEDELASTCAPRTPVRGTPSRGGSNQTSQTMVAASPASQSVAPAASGVQEMFALFSAQMKEQQQQHQLQIEQMQQQHQQFQQQQQQQQQQQRSRTPGHMSFAPDSKLGTPLRKVVSKI